MTSPMSSPVSPVVASSTGLNSSDHEEDKKNSSNSDTGSCSSGSESSLPVRKQKQSSKTHHMKMDNQLDLHTGESQTFEENSSSEEFSDGYDEKFLGDEEDRKKLASMTEREREQVIFTRSERREELKIRFEIKQKLKQTKKMSQQSVCSQPLKQSEPEIEGEAVAEAKQRSHDRKKIMEGKLNVKSQAMDELKAQREERKNRAALKEKMREEELEKQSNDDSKSFHSQQSQHLISSSRKQKLCVTDVYGESDSDSSSSSDDSNLTAVSASEGRHRRRDHRRNTRNESGSGHGQQAVVNRVQIKQDKFDDVGNKKSRYSRSDSSENSDSDSSKNRPRSPVLKYIRNALDLNRIRISRQKCEDYVHHPFFNAMIIGSFVRIGIGQCGDKSMYRVTEVVSVEERSEAYNFGTTRTNKRIRVRYGLDEKVFKLEFVSNSEFTIEEFLRWMTICKEKGVVLPTLEYVKNKAKAIREIRDYRVNDSEITKMVQTKRKFELIPENVAKQKASLLVMKEEALRDSDISRVNEIECEIQKLDEISTSMNESRTTNIRNVALINVRNRKRNMDMIEELALKERQDGDVKKQDEDPFTRRTTKPTRPTTRTKGKETTAPNISLFPVVNLELVDTHDTLPTDDGNKDATTSEPQSQLEELSLNDPNQKDEGTNANSIELGGTARTQDNTSSQKSQDQQHELDLIQASDEQLECPVDITNGDDGVHRTDTVDSGFDFSYRPRPVAEFVKKSSVRAPTGEHPMMIIDKHGFRCEMDEVPYGLRNVTFFVHNHFEDLIALHDVDLGKDWKDAQDKSPPAASFPLQSQGLRNQDQDNLLHDSEQGYNTHLNSLDVATLNPNPSGFGSEDVVNCASSVMSNFSPLLQQAKKKITLDEYKKRRGML